MPELLIAAGACFAVMLLLWMWQRRSKRADWVDVAWAVLIGVQAVAYALVGEGSDEKRLLAAVLAGSWSFRLSRHLWARLASHETEDGRYQAMRDHWGDRADFGLFWFFLAQALVAWLFALPAWVVANDTSAAIDAWVIAGVTIWMVSLLGESIADKTGPPGLGLGPSDHASVAARLRY